MHNAAAQRLSSLVIAETATQFMNTWPISTESVEWTCFSSEVSNAETFPNNMTDVTSAAINLESFFFNVASRLDHWHSQHETHILYSTCAWDLYYCNTSNMSHFWRVLGLIWITEVCFWPIVTRLVLTEGQHIFPSRAVDNRM